MKETMKERIERIQYGIKFIFGKETESEEVCQTLGDAKKFTIEEAKQIIKHDCNQDVLDVDIDELVAMGFIPIKAEYDESEDVYRVFTKNDINKIRVFLFVRGLLGCVFEEHEFENIARVFGFIEACVKKYLANENQGNFLDFSYVYAYDYYEEADDLDEDFYEDVEEYIDEEKTKKVIWVAMICYAYIDMFLNGWFNIKDYFVFENVLSVFYREALLQKTNREQRIEIEVKQKNVQQRFEDDNESNNFYQDAEAEACDDTDEDIGYSLMVEAMHLSETIRIWAKFVLRFEDASFYLGHAMLTQLPKLGEEVGLDLTPVKVIDIYNATLTYSDENDDTGHTRQVS